MFIVWPFTHKKYYTFIYIDIRIYGCVCKKKDIYIMFYEPRKVYTVGLVSNIFMAIEKCSVNNDYFPGGKIKVLKCRKYGSAFYLS